MTAHDVRGDACVRCRARRGFPAWYRPCGETPAPPPRSARPRRTITANGEARSVAEWARALGCRDTTIFERLRAGWPPERAVTEPVMRAGRPLARVSAEIRRHCPAAVLRRHGYLVEVMRTAHGWMLSVEEPAREETRDAAE